MTESKKGVKGAHAALTELEQILNEALRVLKEAQDG